MPNYSPGYYLPHQREEGYKLTALIHPLFLPLGPLRATAWLWNWPVFPGRVGGKIQRPQARVLDDYARLDMLKARTGGRAQPLICFAEDPWGYPWAEPQSNILADNASTHLHLQLSGTHKKMHCGHLPYVAHLSPPISTGFVETTCTPTASHVSHLGFLCTRAFSSFRNMTCPHVE